MSIQELLREETNKCGVLDLAKALDTVYVDVLLYKLTTVNFPSYPVKTMFSYLNSRTFEASFQTPTSTSRRIRARVAQGGIISYVLFSLYVNYMLSPSRHVELVLCADHTAVIATSGQPSLFAKYPETYLGDLERWLSEWWIVINVSKNSVMLFAKTGRCTPKTRSVQLFGESIQLVDGARYLGMTLDERLTRSKYTDQVRKRYRGWDLS